MYNTKAIEKTMDRLKTEIQAVIDKYEPVLNAQIRAQIPAGKRLYAGMGSVVIDNERGATIAETFSDYLAMEMLGEDWPRGFNIECI